MMNVALIFECPNGFVLEQRHIICFNGLTTLDFNSNNPATYYDAEGNRTGYCSGPFKLIGLGWWRYAGNEEREIPGGSSDHIACKAEPTIKERKILNLLQWEKRFDEIFGMALKKLNCWAFVSSDWPISCAVAYLQAYRNTSNFLHHHKWVNEVFEASMEYSNCKSWVAVWDVICNEGPDTTILSYAGDEPIKKVAKKGFLFNKRLFQDGDKKMTVTNMYRKGSQSYTVSGNCPGRYTFIEEGSRHRRLYSKVGRLQATLIYSSPAQAIEALNDNVPTEKLVDFTWRIAE
jgi:hypothetical protein